MKTLNKRLIIGLAAILAGAFTHNAIAADATGTATADVLAPLGISQSVEMDFGTVAGDTASATTVVLTTAGTTSSIDGAFTSGTPAAGIFDVTGEPSQAYSITLPAAPVTLTSGVNTMSATAFNHDAGASPALDGTGNDSFNVGATLNLAAGQPAGTYNGSYTVTVDYQ